MNSLVTGSTGFIGGALVRRLLERGDRVACLIRGASDPSSLKGLDVELARADYTDAGALKQAVRGRDVVFHVGALIRGGDWNTFRRANIEATLNLAAACRESNPALKRFVFVSSIAAAGPSPERKPLKENDPDRPVSFYGRSKHEAEQGLEKDFSDLPWTVIRPTNVLGPGQQEIEQLMMLLKLRLFPMLGDGNPQTSIIFVDDLVDALLLAAEKEAAVQRVYFAANREFHSWRGLADTLRRELGIGWVLRVPYPVMFALATAAGTIARLLRLETMINPQQVGNVRRQYWLHDTTRIRAELGWQEKTTLREGMRKVVEASGKTKKG